MAKLEYLVIHCTATPKGRDVSVEDIKQWHLKGRGWSRVGYSDLITLDGSLINMIEFDQDDEVDNWEISNGASGFNGKARHLVYAGGCSEEKPEWAKFYPAEDTRTPEQKETLALYVKFMIKRHPHIKVIGHNQIANKACPSFPVPEWLTSIGVSSKNIGL